MSKVQIRTTKKEGEAPLYMRFRIGEESIWMNLMGHEARDHRGVQFGQYPAAGPRGDEGEDRLARVHPERAERHP